MNELIALAAQRGLSIKVLNSAAEHAQLLAEIIIGTLQAAIAERGHASLALSGGRSPVPLLRVLNEAELAWEKVSLTLVDERWVPAEHADSNAGLLWRHMPAVMPRVQWTPLYHGESPAQDAQRSSAALAEFMPLDTVVLGMGSDGHTASLFPGAENLAQLLAPDEQTLCMPAQSSASAQRLTLTGAALKSARLQLLAIRGEDKAVTLAAALAEQHPEWPISAFLRAPLEIVYSPDGG